MISKWALAKPFLLEQACDIYCIQETHFLSSDVYDFNLPKYTRYDTFGNGDRRQGGVCLYVVNTYPHSPLALQTCLQAVACTVRIGSVRLTVCSLYLPPTDALLYVDLVRLLDQLPEPLIICTDANSKHRLWGSSQCDRRGMIWERLIRQCDLCVLNSGHPTRLDEYSGLFSHIDLTLTSSTIAQYMDWTTDEDLHDSDHFPIYITFDKGEDTIHFTDIFYGWNLNKARWDEFREKCVLKFEEQLGVDNCKAMTDVIIQAATAAIPKKTGYSKYSCPWWTDDCKRAIAETKRAHNRFRRNRGIPLLLLAYKKAKAKARQTIRLAKKESWNKLLSVFIHSTPISKLWGIIRKFTQKKRYNRPLPVLIIGGVKLDDPLEVGDALGKYFSNISSGENYSVPFRRHVKDIPDVMSVSTSDNMECYNMTFTLDELMESIKNCGQTSIGPDTIHYVFFKHMGELQLQQILHLFNYIWKEGCYPAEWLHSYIVPILKPGKVASKAESYRPIQLTSCFGKVMERMVTRRMTWFVEKEGMISNFQCGFRKARSTVDHIVRLESEIRRGFFYHKYTLAVFLDFKSAYNLVNIPALLLKLYHFGFRGRLMSFIKNYLSHRTFQVKCGRLSNVFIQENGVVQGGILSPILFNLMINDLFDNVPDGFSYAMYADDCAIWIQGRHLPRLVQAMQNALNCLVEWTNIWGFQFTPSKCSAVIFHRYMNKKEMINIPHLTINGEQLCYDEGFKFLGVYLDSKLNMNQHIQYLRARAMKRLPLLKCLAGRGCGADRTVLLKIYKSLIRPILEYACQVLDGPANKSVESLESVQNTCLRIATGALRTSPIIPLQVEADIPPLYMRRWELTMRYGMRVTSVEGHPCSFLIDGMLALPHMDWSYLKRIAGFPIYERLRHISQKLDFPLPQEVKYKASAYPPWQLSSCDAQKLFERKDTHDRIDVLEAFQDFKCDHQGFHFIYTDGSKSARGVGCAFVHGEMSYQTKLKRQYAIFTAESIALLQAIHYVNLHCMPKSVICVDSLSVLLALQATESFHPLIVEARDELQRLKERHLQCIILWVPAHSGISGNEMADSQAKQAVLKTGCEEAYEVRVKDYIPSLRTACLAQFCSLWHHYDSPTNLKRIKHGVGHWVSSTRSNRREEIVLCRLRLGHTRFTHSFILDQDARPECLQCHRYQTVRHILIECPNYDVPRRNLVALCLQYGMPMDLSSLLGDSHNDVIDAVLDFLRVCDLFQKL